MLVSVQSTSTDTSRKSQNLVIEEFIKCEYCLWEELENFDEDSVVM